MRINHNVTAQLANINLKKTNKRLTSSLESLSSGYKINSAADDSAGLAISNKMRTQIRALDQASRNAEDGTSIIQTAEGASSEVAALLQRMRELSVQAANDTNTLEDRDAIQVEVDKLQDEIDRIGSTTEFNGNGLLDGSFTRVVTYDTNGLSTLFLSEEVKAGEYELTINQKATSATLNTTFPATGTITINDVSIELGKDPQEEIRDACDKMGIDVDFTGGNNMTLTTRATGSAQKITIGGDAPAGNAAGTDAQIEFSGDNLDNDTVVYAEDGKNIIVKASSGFEIQVSVEDTATVGDKATVTVYDTGSMILQIGANEHQNIGVDFPEISCRTLMLKETDGTSLVNVCSQDGATKAISTFENAIRTVSEARSQLGAYQNRLDSTVDSLDVTSENLTGAMARIIDTDMAAAMTNYTQESVLVQASTSILAQANNRPQQILSLLQS